MNSQSANVVGRQVQSVEATILRLQRPCDYQTAVIARDEFLGYSCCSVEYPAPHLSPSHKPQLGVYKAIPLGTVVGGTPLQKVASFLRIKLANLIHGYRTH